MMYDYPTIQQWVPHRCEVKDLNLLDHRHDCNEETFLQYLKHSELQENLEGMFPL